MFGQCSCFNSQPFTGDCSMENYSTFTIAVITATITFIGMCIKTFTTMRDNILHQSKFIPKYRYHFDYITQNNYPLTIIKLTLEQGNIPYYIKKIYLMKYRFNCKIIYCKINGHHCVLIFCFVFCSLVSFSV